MENMEYLSGVVERITYINEDTGFCVLKIKSKSFPELVTAVGNIGVVNVGASVDLKGVWKHDGKYGKQFSVYDYCEVVPATVAGIEKYLGSGLIKGVGPVNAQRIVARFKEDTLRIIEEEPDRLAEVEGIGPKRVEMIKDGWRQQKEIKNVMLFLQGNGVSSAYAVKIYKTYGNDSIKVVKENPFRLADEIWGIGFKTADKIARKLGFSIESYERCRSGIIYTLNELANEGHCFATAEQLVSRASKILELDEGTIIGAIEKMKGENSIIHDTEDAIYLPPFYYSETGTAMRIKEILLCKNPFFTSGSDSVNDEIIRNVQNECGIKYDEFQLCAIKNALKSKFTVITGGPGTGKTTITLAIIKIFQRLGAKVLLASPTGRAAKRLSEATGMEAKTIHRLLEYNPLQGYGKNPESPLDCDVLIVDETSMVDVVLMYNLLKAVPNTSIVILIGDADQLPSVGAGNVLKDIIDSGVVDVVRLTRIFRQAQGSRIIMNAHKVNNGSFPILKGGKDSDFFFIEEENPAKIVEIIKELCSKRLPEYYKVNPITDVQVLCPMQRGVTGTQNLNMVLQETLNPKDVFLKYGGTQYRPGDKVMQIKNNYDKNVFNGDIGVIADVDLEDKIVRIDFDGNIVEYDVTELDEVVLAYASTVHKSQGSEYKIVVAPFTTQHFIMLQRNLLYTCITRAKKAFVLIGSKKAIGIAVSNNKTETRNSMLSKRLKEAVLHGN